MYSTKCGCPFCRKQDVPTSRAGWKGRQNKHRRGFGIHVKGGRSRGKRKQGGK